ncbi:hypothetical protein J2Z66_008366 [Paenibacillus eucommiae]|uniref:Uncharacterized protein n=1 Tax=Paenibacillus eucommiae TaxID=1355755 RepID=A0ABS4JA38_9BACL|nr:hypothetical protein [Paenibacillus eucommiae]
MHYVFSGLPWVNGPAGHGYDVAISSVFVFRSVFFVTQWFFWKCRELCVINVGRFVVG